MDGLVVFGSLEKYWMRFLFSVFLKYIFFYIKNSWVKSVGFSHAFEITFEFFFNLR